MVHFYEEYTGTCIRMLPTVENQCSAILELTRPYEVADRIKRLPRYLLPKNYTVAGELAAFFRRGDLKYKHDPNDDYDYWYSPRATLIRQGGDCEDFSIFALSILEATGIPSYMVTGTWNGGGHAWVEGKDERGWFMLETTEGKLYRNPEHPLWQRCIMRPPGYQARLAISRDLCTPIY